MSKHIFLPGLLAFVLTFFVCLGFAQADLPVPALTKHVVDLTSTLSPDELVALDNKLMAYEQEKGSQIAVLMVPTTGPETIEQYSMRVVEQWKLGRKRVDDGVLFLIAKDDRMMRIEVGYGLEGALPDITAKRIISDIVAPNFKAGNFLAGINAGVDAILSSIKGEPLIPPPVAHNSYNPHNSTSTIQEDVGSTFLMGFVVTLLLARFMPIVVAVVVAPLLIGLIVAEFMFSYKLGFIAGLLALLGGIVAFLFGAWAFGTGSSSGGSGWSGGSWGGGGGGGFGGGGASGGW